MRGDRKQPKPDLGAAAATTTTTTTNSTKSNDDNYRTLTDFTLSRGSPMQTGMEIPQERLLNTHTKTMASS